MSTSGGVHLIAEAGTNHGGDLAVAEQLVDVAMEAGADSVKFQIIYPDGLYLPKLRRGADLVENEVFAARSAQLLSRNDLQELNTYARDRGILLSASVFDAQGLEQLDEMDAPYVKIASCDLNNGPLLEAAARRGRTLVVSTGMSTLAEIDEAVRRITRTGFEDLVLLHCVSVYPAPTERMNLAFLRVLLEEFSFPVGLSDHTEQDVAGPMAVALGATWIEKHYTLDRSAEGFDHAYALEPDHLERYVAAIRAAEQAIAGRDPKVGREEAIVRQRARRGLYAARDLTAGENVTRDDVLIVRPEGPLEPNDVDEVVGSRVRRDVGRYTALSWDVLE